MMPGPSVPGGSSRFSDDGGCMADLDRLVELAADLASDGRRRVLGVTGSPGAGKTTVSEGLVAALGSRAALVQMDGFHLAGEELRRLGRSERKGAPDTFDVAGYASLLERIRFGQDQLVYAPRFDRDMEEPIGSAVPVPPEAPLVITEGNYLLHDSHGWERIGRLLDECWYLEVDDDLRETRLIDRRVSHGDSLQHSRTWVREVDGVNARIVSSTRDRANRRFRVLP